MPSDRRDEIIRLASTMIGTALLVSSLFLGLVDDHEFRDRAWLLVMAALGGSLVYRNWRDLFRSGNRSGSEPLEPGPKATTKFGQFIERYW